jgi:hypothetical protein
METSQTKRPDDDRIAHPIFSADPAESRVVEPMEGWPTYLSTQRALCTEDDEPAVWGCRIAEPLEPMRGPLDAEWEDEDPLIREWFKIGRMLLAERSPSSTESVPY